MEMPPLPVLYLATDKLTLSPLFSGTWGFLCAKPFVKTLQLLYSSTVILTVSLTVTVVTAVIFLGVTAHG